MSWAYTEGTEELRKNWKQDAAWRADNQLPFGKIVFTVKNGLWRILEVERQCRLCVIQVSPKLAVHPYKWKITVKFQSDFKSKIDQ